MKAPLDPTAHTHSAPRPFLTDHDASDAQQRAALIRHHMEALEELAGPDRRERADGWTGMARRIFLDTLAQTGEVGKACDYTGRSRQSAYALRARDPIFAAGWDAACELARSALADMMLERAMAGTVETITRNGEVIAQKHRYDGRLAMSVLNRLDARADRAAESGTAHFRALGRWTDFLEAVGTDDEAAAQAVIAPPPPPAPDDEPCQSESTLLEDSVWFDPDRDCWMTRFPPPEDFEGHEEAAHPFGLFYERECTSEEAGILDRTWPDFREEESEKAQRDRFFNELRAELDAMGPEEKDGLAVSPCMLHEAHEA